ncbi:MAG TPA: cytochrome c biogenesis protein CcdA [Gemmatimonadaceae bacterium]|nr:cytochrome c biogenesis protein CcdA [Gemmatimonadaceae bacterium]
MSAGFIWLAASAGLLSLLTPCVFPMVPITVAYFSGDSASRSRGIRAALLFALGIIGTFTILGLTLAGIFGAAGLNRFAASPTVNLVFAALFLVFAANLFGWLDLSLPSSIINRANRGAGRSDTAGPLLIGATFTLTSVTCTAPFVGTLLVLASRGSWLTPVTGMLVFSAAFALPFFVLALAPRYLARLPRAGEWMQTMRVLIGLLEVAAAIKFVSNADMVQHWGVFTRDMVLLSWAVVAVVGAVYLARGLLRARPVGGLRLASAIPPVLALSTAAWLMSGRNGRPLPQLEAFLPPVAAASVPTPGTLSPAGNSWIINDHPAALAAGRATGKLIFLDFTGYTCTNCRWMEANVFTHAGVAAELEQFVLSRLYTDGEGPVYEQQQAFQEEKFGTVALPLYAVVDPDGRVRGTFTGLTRDPAQFIAFLRRARTALVASR